MFHPNELQQHLNNINLNKLFNLLNKLDHKHHYIEFGQYSPNHQVNNHQYKNYYILKVTNHKLIK